ncbi:MAG: CvpA family protein [Bacteroidota bacterium]
MAFIDVVIGMVLIIFMISGYRSGFLKKIIGIACLIGALVLATKFSADVHQMVFADMGLSNSTGFFLSFVLIVVAITFIQSVLYRVIFKEMSEALWNNILGLVLGLFEGALAISITLIVLSIYLDMPSADTKNRSEAYKPVKNFAPMVFDQVNTFLPESEDFYYQIVNSIAEQKKKLETK